MNDDELKIAIIVAIVLASLMHKPASVSHKQVDTKQVVMVENLKTKTKHKKSLSKDFRNSPEVIQGMDNIPVKKHKGELSRAIEPNHKINGLNGLNGLILE